MHGRLKIKSTAQQQAEREAAQKKKLAIYQHASEEIMARRGNNRHDIETLKLISTVLEKNPDVTVLWNYRREVLTTLLRTLPKDEIESLIDMELEFDAICLRVNPKSYYAWHHRCWILLNSPNPNWERELMLTAKFLGADERNFHCWDYRRWLVRQASVSPEKEIDFVTAKLYDNFSNFSAWHYRSRLIPKVNGHRNGEMNERTLKQETLVEEFDMVKNALYVDPQDQSPWFYHRWLLSNCCERKLILHTVIYDKTTGCLMVSFSNPVIKATVDEMEIRLLRDKEEMNENNKVNYLIWRPVRNGNASSVWSAELPVELKDETKLTAMLQIKHSYGPPLHVTLDSTSFVQTSIDPKILFYTMDSKVKSLVDGELESIRDLHSMEENSKWVILELTALLRFTSPVESEAEVLSLVDKLVGIDPLRESYYNDLRSRIFIENQIIKSFGSAFSSFCLESVGLTRLTLVEWLVTMKEIDLSNNKLRTLPDDCHYLISLVKLDVSGNLLSSLNPLCHLPRLQQVIACNNKISDFRNVKPVLHNQEIQTIDIRENELSCDNNREHIDKISEDFPNISLIYR